MRDRRLAAVARYHRCELQAGIGHRVEWPFGICSSIAVCYLC